MAVAVSKNGVSIRLTDERWQHITVGHPEVADYYFEILETIEQPQIIFEGRNEELIAIKKFEKISPKFIVVIYKELNIEDGFIITSFVSKRQQEFAKKKIIWKQKN
jgi:hypothetical protein